MKKPTLYYPRPAIDGTGSAVVAHAGSMLLLRTAQTVGLTRALREAMAGWRKPLAVHDPGKILLDLAVSLAIGGDCLADIAQLRAAPEVFGLVASDPTVSRCIDALAADAPAALTAINTARATARANAWSLAGEHAPDHDAEANRPVVIDVDATLITSHSDKEAAAPTFKRGYGHHPLWAFVDHGAAGTGEPLSFLLRKGNAGSNTAADHLTVIKAALAQLPGGHTRGKKVLIRIDGAGSTHELLAGRRPDVLGDPADHRLERRRSGQGVDAGDGRVRGRAAAHADAPRRLDGRLHQPAGELRLRGPGVHQRRRDDVPGARPAGGSGSAWRAPATSVPTASASAPRGCTTRDGRIGHCVAAALPDPRIQRRHAGPATGDRG
ncbi:Transposase DDE domain group 1 [Blastococcus aggregatus]|uniref:Transposase DDE domain group 1 n=1 Tax=Blastococcus aggregatus TaxID=38502 RepID=A0A285VH15_9ACTN|nr:Transposase DDE domain group 1 [Blastococcus aggregatus]